MACRRALFLLVLVLTLLQVAFAGGFGGCHPAASRAVESTVSTDAMPCHQAQAADEARASLRAGDEARAGLRALGCCAGHPTCGACNAPSFTSVRPRAFARQPELVAQVAEGAPAEVARDGRTLDHSPL